MTISGIPFEKSTWILSNGVEVCHQDVGILVFKPQNAKRNVVISSGIHGDETAPIELVDRLAVAMLKGDITPEANVMLVIGHPDAINAHTRFLTENMNRLFKQENDTANIERVIANRLQKAVTKFFCLGSTSGEKWHLDLHSAIRGSKHYMFGVLPHTTKPQQNGPLAVFLQQSAMDALMISDAPSGTFSWYSAEHHDALAATLEMGRVAPLYQNDLSEFEFLEKALISLMTEGDAKTADWIEGKTAVYQVSRTIYKTSDNFKLGFPGSAENFTRFPSGSLLAEEDGKTYVADEDGESVVFPNANVAIGQRACLLVKPVSISTEGKITVQRILPEAH
ncbi:succinylglutamate desuccinylase [Parasalinivibrio latis]